MTPKDVTNFLIEVTPEVYREKDRMKDESTLREQIDEALYELTGSTRHMNFAVDLAYKRIVSAMAKHDQAKRQELLDSLEYRDNTDSKRINPEYDDHISVGYNMAIDEIKKLLDNVYKETR